MEKRIEEKNVRVIPHRMIKRYTKNFTSTRRFLSDRPARLWVGNILAFSRFLSIKFDSILIKLNFLSKCVTDVQSTWINLLIIKLTVVLLLLFLQFLGGMGMQWMHLAVAESGPILVELHLILNNLSRQDSRKLHRLSLLASEKAETQTITSMILLSTNLIFHSKCNV